MNEIKRPGQKPRVMIAFDGHYWRAAEIVFRQQAGSGIYMYTTRGLGGGGFDTPEQALKQIRKKVKEHRKEKETAIPIKPNCDYFEPAFEHDAGCTAYEPQPSPQGKGTEGL